MRRTTNRRQERSEWILAADGIPSLAQQSIPLLVVHRLSGRPMITKHPHRNLHEPLPPQPLVELLQAHLRSEPQHARQSNQRLLILLRLCTRAISKILQTLSALTLLSDAHCQSSVLSTHGLVELGGRPAKI